MRNSELPAGWIAYSSLGPNVLLHRTAQADKDQDNEHQFSVVNAESLKVKYFISLLSVTVT